MRVLVCAFIALLSATTLVAQQPQGAAIES